jgi:hypothetical protein
VSEHEPSILDRRRGRTVAYVPLVWFVLVGVDPLAHRLYLVLRRPAAPDRPARVMA